MVCSATAGTKTALGIIQLWFQYFAASFFKALGNEILIIWKFPKSTAGRVFETPALHPCSYPHREFLIQRPAHTKFNPLLPRSQSSTGCRIRLAKVGICNPCGLNRPPQDFSTQPLTPNETLDKPQVRFYKSSIWSGRESNPSNLLWWRVLTNCVAGLVSYFCNMKGDWMNFLSEFMPLASK